MDGQSREDVERRLIETEAVVERCLCEKTGKKKPVIRGYAALFNSDSQDLGGFVERIAPGAFDDVMKRGTDVVALYNHDPMFLLGRESSGTLRISVDDRGLRYEIDPPESRADVIEAIERGDVRGSSFAFRVKGSGESWSRTADGRQLREIRAVDGLFDVGPVLKPAYVATESFVSRRALDMVQARMYEQGEFVAWDGGVGRIEYVMEEGQLGEYLESPMEAKPGDPIVLVRKYEFEEGYWEETDEFIAKMMSELVGASGIMGEVPAFIDQMPDQRAEAGSLAVGDFVSWNSSGGTARGKITKIKKDGSIDVPDSSFAVKGTADNPAVLIRVYDEDGPTDRLVGHRAETLKKIASLESSRGEDKRDMSLRPTAGMAAAAKRGLRLHEEGKSGDGLKPETVARANKIARREELTDDHVREMNAWFARHETASKSPGWDKAGEEKPGFVAWLLWGGTPAKNWAKRKSAAMERSIEEPGTEIRAEDTPPESGSLSSANYALYEALNNIAEAEGMWPQEGPDGSHYMAASPFAARGMMCSNCVFFNEGGSCDVVGGQIEEKGLCKLWIIPEEKLSAKEEMPAERSIDAAATAARLKATALESASRGHSR